MAVFSICLWEYFWYTRSDLWCCIKVKFKPASFGLIFTRCAVNWQGHAVGNRCEPTLTAHAVLLDKVKSLISRRRRARVQSAASEALKELANLGFGAVVASSKIQKDIESLLRGQTSLAEYPYATLLASVSEAIFAGLLIKSILFVHSLLLYFYYYGLRALLIQNFDGVLGVLI